jgi:CO/xanthine dehydrogenase Mo-binding subunit
VNFNEIDSDSNGLSVIEREQNKQMGWFGASIKRKEDADLLMGRGRYVDDIALPGMHAVVTFADLPSSMQRQTVPLLVPSPAIKQPYMPCCLAKDEACLVGEPVAMVVADSRYLAEDAAVLVAVDFEPLPAVSDSPQVEVLHMMSPSPFNPLGLKGAGEGGTIPAIAALLSVVENALAPFGVHVAEAPNTPERIVALIGAAAGGHAR